MSMSDETKQMQAAARASLNILFQRLTENLETSEKTVQNNATRVAMAASVADARQAVTILTGIVGHLQITSYEGMKARNVFAQAVRNFNKCVRYPEEFWDYPEWQESFKVQCNMVESTLQEMRIVCMPEELVLLKAGILQGLGMRFNAFDKELVVERGEAKGGKATANETKAAAETIAKERASPFTA